MPFTPMTAGQKEPLSPLAAKRLWPWATAWRSTGSRASMIPVRYARLSQAPKDALASRARSSATQRANSAAMSPPLSEVVS